VSGAQHLAEAKRLLDAGASVPVTWQAAMAHALVAQAEATGRQAAALETLLHKLEGLTNDGGVDAAE
jgi:hypothetical protein